VDLPTPGSDAVVETFIFPTVSSPLFARMSFSARAGFSSA
jgi:hypothetical protein